MSEASITGELARWATSVRLADMPEDVIAAAENRILDVIGLVLLGRSSELGPPILRGCGSLGGPAEAHVLGDALPTGAATAALVNGALAQAIEFDDTHTGSVVHVGAAVVAAALAAAEAADASGPDTLRAVAVASEVTCRLAMLAAGEYHPRGFHPTGIICPFGAVYAAGLASGASASHLTNATGIVGSQAAGLLACWADGTSAKAIHPGWAAHSAIVALRLAEHGLTGPARVVEGRHGLLASHIQEAAVRIDAAGATRDLGVIWESRDIAFKPYPAAHVLHGLIEAALSIAAEMDPQDIAEVVCIVEPHWVPIVCEPTDAKRRPPNASAARISLHHTLAEALATGRLDGKSYSTQNLADPTIHRLADLVAYTIDQDRPDPKGFAGDLRVAARDGRRITARVPSSLGGRRRPLSSEQIADKFRGNAESSLTTGAADRVCGAVRQLRNGLSARSLIALLTRPGGRETPR